jgi:hypothetical protein
MSARQIDVQREKIANAEMAAMKIDVLILIDATESMDPYGLHPVLMTRS